MFKKYIALSISSLIFLLLILLSCDETPTKPQFKEEIIVRGYIYVGSGIDTIFISKSLPIGQKYSYEAAAVSDADVLVSVDEKTFQLFEYTGKPGAYYLPKDSLIVEAGTEYRLEVQVDDKLVRAKTIAPAQVHIDSINTDTLPYLGDKFFNVYWQETEFVEGYVITTIAKPPYINRIHIGVFIDSSEVDRDSLEAFPPINSLGIGKRDFNFEIPWFLFWYYGNYTIKLYAGDQNLFDISAAPVMYPPHQSSEFEQPPNHIEGGIGIFSAVSVDSIHVHVKRQEPE